MSNLNPDRYWRRNHKHFLHITSSLATAEGPRQSAREIASGPLPPGTPPESKSPMPDDAHAHRERCPKTAPPAHPAGTCESRALYRATQRHAHPTSETYLPGSSRIQSPPLARIVPAPRSTDPPRATPKSAALPARPTSCCQSCSARLRLDSASSAAC